jgi:integrase
MSPRFIAKGGNSKTSGGQMATHDMTAKWLDSLKPGPKRRDYFDRDCPGLCLRVTPSGVKTWSLLYRHAGRLRRLTIGNYPAIGLQKARKEGHSKRGSVQLGKDPAAEKQALRAADTFGDLAKQYLQAKKHKRSIREDRRIVEIYLNPRFEHVKCALVSRADIGSMLQFIAADAPIMANRVLACIRGIFNWAIGAGIIESTPCVQLKAPAPEKKRTRSLSDEEIKRVWAALEAGPSSIADVYKLRLTTAQRGNEVMGMAWGEIDLDARWWTIPAERSKNKKPHRVWLSDSVLRILERRQAANEKRSKRSGGPSVWVFPGKRKGKHLMEPKRAFADIAKASGVENWTGHDLRRTAATAMTRDLKVSRFIVGRVLNHSEGNDVTGHYDVYEYDDEKRDVLDRWSKRLAVIITDLKIAQSPDTSHA